MARGWESKSVESQQEEAEASKDRRVPLTAAQQKLAGLQLSRKRVAGEISAGTSERFRQLKQRALDHLDAEIQKLQESDCQE